MSKIILVLFLSLLSWTAFSQCGSQLTLVGNTTDGKFQQLLLASFQSNTADNTQSEIVSEAWTCSSLGFPTCQFRSIMKYDVSAIPANAIILNAQLSLYAKTNNINGNAGNPTFGTANTSLLQKVTSPWTLTTTGWSNQPTTTTSGQKILAQSATTSQNYTVDLTDFVQAWVTAPATNYGMMIRLQNEQYYNSMIFNSGQAAANLRPTLTITYVVPGINTLVIQGNPTDGLYDQLLLASFQSNTADNTQSEIVSEAWTCNSLGFPTCQFRSLLKYKVSAIPSTAIITSAKLYLHAKTDNINGNVGNPTFGTANASFLQKVTAAWTLTTTGWSNQPATTTTGQKTLAQSASNAQDYTVDVTDFVQSWTSSPSTNYGMMIRLQNEQYYNSMIFNSGQAAANLRPTLIVCYTFPTAVADVNGGTNNVQISPNPVAGPIRVNITATKNYVASLLVTDAVGKEVYRSQNPMKQGQNILVLEDIPKMSSGIYFLTVTSPQGRSIISKLMVQ